MAGLDSNFSSTSVEHQMRRNAGLMPIVFGLCLIWVSSGAEELNMSVAACVFAISIWVVYTIRSSPASLGIFAFFLVASFVEPRYYY
jgi:hypothetical protein